MIGLIQRVSGAQIGIEGSICAKIGAGLLVLAAIERGDGMEQAAKLAARLVAGEIHINNVAVRDKFRRHGIGSALVSQILEEAKRKEAIRIVENGKQRMLRDDYTGKIEEVNGYLLLMLLENGYTPVIAPLAISSEGDALNVDADRAAAMVAGVVKAEQLIILSNVPGLLRQFPDESTLIPHIDKAQVEQSLKFAEGRMKKKVLGASEALGLGVAKVVFADGRVEGPVANALAGNGTVIS